MQQIPEMGRHQVRQVPSCAIANGLQKADPAFVADFVEGARKHLATAKQEIPLDAFYALFCDSQYRFNHLSDSVYSALPLDDRTLASVLDKAGYGEGDGAETKPGGKMYSVFSSSALVVSVFGFPSETKNIVIHGQEVTLKSFEKQFPDSPDRPKLLKIDHVSPKANLDAWLENPKTGVAIESKCFEPLYTEKGQHSFERDFSKSYFDSRDYWENGEQWAALLDTLKKTTGLKDSRFDWPQNIKHMIGLFSSKVGKEKKILLIDIFYDIDSRYSELRRRYEECQGQFKIFKQTLGDFGVNEKFGVDFELVSLPYSELIKTNDFKNQAPNRYEYLKDRYYFNQKR